MASGWFMVDLFVGLSYLVQALLIVPPILILNQKLRTPQNTAPIKKWALIAAPAFVFALYFEYMFLWADTLSPMGPKTATAASTLGAANSLITLAVAGVITIAACYTLNRSKSISKPLAGAALILVGAFFIIYSIASLFEPVYASFWYLTDTWMITLPTLGIALITPIPKQK
jgi:heme/copper-type cytochrome/quinol oxidase subunit 3